MRFLMATLALGSLAACGRSNEPAAENMKLPPGMASEVTVELPPPAEPTKVELAGPDGQFASYFLKPPEPENIAAGWAGVLRKNGFPCGRITSARELEGEEGRAMGIYRIECDTGAVYQGTRRDGRVRFRHWPGQPSAT